MPRKVRQKKEKKNETPLTYVGRIEIVRNGMGYVSIPELEQDILIRPEMLGAALDGDDVRVQRLQKSGKGRMEGRILEVIKRNQTQFSGRLDVREHFAFLIPDKDNMPVDIFVPKDLLRGAVNGDQAIVRITGWPEKSRSPVGEVVQVMTDESQNEIAMQGILIDHGFPLRFPEEVLEQAERIPEGVATDEIKKRRDFRDVLTFTVDPVDAKDFDDAISIRKMGRDEFEIGVHIADVSHYIEPGSALDEEAYARATSVYLPDRVLPMLPERLSNELCSLRPQEEKYTFSVVFRMTRSGRVKDYWLGRTVIKSAHRFAYEDVQEIIEGAQGLYKDEILALNEIAQSLRKQRFQKGAIHFSSREIRFVLDEESRPVGVITKESQEAHQLIEELMLLANKQVAAYVTNLNMENKPVRFPYRVHDVPDEEKLKIFTTFAARFGHRFDLNSPEKIARSFNQMLAETAGRPEQQVLETLGIRTMAKAVYTTENIGHYGLGFEYYCHFTSPIRRYPDIMVHRILQACLEGRYRKEHQMETRCRHCSNQEREAMEAERDASKYKQVEFMQQFVGCDFDAVVSGTASFGFWAQTVDHACEGMVSISDLSELDVFELMEHEYALIGRHTGIRIGMGDRLRVRVVATSLDKRQIDFVLAGAIEELRRTLPRRRELKKGHQGARN